MRTPPLRWTQRTWWQLTSFFVALVVAGFTLSGPAMTLLGPISSTAQDSDTASAESVDSGTQSPDSDESANDSEESDESANDAQESEDSDSESSDGTGSGPSAESDDPASESSDGTGSGEPPPERNGWGVNAARGSSDGTQAGPS